MYLFSNSDKIHSGKNTGRVFGYLFFQISSMNTVDKIFLDLTVIFYCWYKFFIKAQFFLFIFYCISLSEKGSTFVDWQPREETLLPLSVSERHSDGYHVTRGKVGTDVSVNGRNVQGTSRVAPTVRETNVRPGQVGRSVAVQGGYVCGTLGVRCLV